MRTEYTKDAVKTLRGYDRLTRERITKKIENLTKTPIQGDIRPLAGKANTYRLRVGDFRVLFTIDIDEEVILINKVSSRGDVYKE
jgi:mRNA interferase RelE/StbE